MFKYLIAIVLLFVPLYPKFPLLGVSGTFVAIRLEDLVVAAIYVAWLVWALVNKKWKNILPAERAIILYLIIGAIATFSGIFLTKSTSISLGALHFLRRIEYMGLFFVAYSSLKSLKDLSFVVKTMVVVAAIVALYGLGQQFAAFPVISTNNSEFSKGLALGLGPGARINSTFAGHYDLAAYSIFPLLLILGLLMLPIKGKPILVVIGLLSYWAMLLSASRVSFAALFVVAGLLVVIMRKPRWILVLGVMAIVGIMISPQLVGRYRELLINQFKFTLVSPVHAAVDAEEADALKAPPVAEDRSLNIRLNASWPRALRSFYKNPFVGTGFSSIGLAADNDYLRMLAETGALGLLAFALIMWRFYKQVIPIALKPKLDLKHVFVLSMACGLLGLLINALFIDVFEASKVAIMTWTLLGITEKTIKLT